MAVITIPRPAVEDRSGRRIAEVKVDIANVKADLVRWMFIFWVGQIGVITGILFAFFKR